jgi:hypothetical protein
MKYIRVFSDDLDGKVFTEQAFAILKEKLCNGDSSHYETKEIGIVEVGENEKIFDVADLPALGYSIPKETVASTEGEEVLTEQSDDEFFDTLADSEDDL